MKNHNHKNDYLFYFYFYQSSLKVPPFRSVATRKKTMSSMMAGGGAGAGAGAALGTGYAASARDSSRWSFGFRSFFKWAASEKTHSRRLVVFLGLNLIVVSSELLIAAYSGSIALMCDAVHMALSCVGLLIALLSMYLETVAMGNARVHSPEFTFGLSRFQVLSAFTNASLALFAAIFILVEAIHRCAEPSEFHTSHVLVVATVGLLTNMIGLCFFGDYIRERNVRTKCLTRRASSMYRLRAKEAAKAKKRKAARRVQVRDYTADVMLIRSSTEIMSSLGVIASTVLVKNGWIIADPLISIFLAFVIVYTAYPLFKATGLILLQTTPRGERSKLDRAMREASSVDGVLECYKEHFWTLAPGKYVGTMNVRLRKNADEASVLQQLYKIFSPRVHELTVQMEYDRHTGNLVTMPNPEHKSRQRIHHNHDCRDCGHSHLNNDEPAKLSRTLSDFISICEAPDDDGVPSPGATMLQIL